MKISFISSYYNNLALTNEMIESLLATVPNDLDFELIIVNDASNDKTTPPLTEIENKKIKHIENTTNLGFAMSNNIGAKAATGDFLFFINNDLYFLNEWIEPILIYLRLDNNCIVGNIQQRYSDKVVDHSGVNIWINAEQKLFEFRHATDSKKNVPKSTNRMPAVTGACFAISRELFESLDGFDEQFVNGCEDLDLCYRARKAGTKIELAYDSAVLHHVSATRGQNRLRDEQNSLRLFQKHPDQIIQDIARQYCINALTNHDDRLEHREFYKDYVSGNKIEAPIDAKLKAKEIYFNTIKMLEQNIALGLKKSHDSLEKHVDCAPNDKFEPALLTPTKKGECNYLKKIGENGVKHAKEKPYSDPECAFYLASMGTIMHLLPKKPAKVLDLGCGTGWTSVMLAKAGYQVVGQDISPDMIQVAEQNKSEAGLKNLSFVTEDYESLAYENAFDAALFFDALHHCDDEVAAIKSAFNALKHGGILITHEPGVGHSKTEASIRAMQVYGVNERDMPPKQIIACGLAAGFSEYRIYPMQHDIFELLYSWERPSPRSREGKQLLKRLSNMVFNPVDTASSIVVLKKS